MIAQIARHVCDRNKSFRAGRDLDRILNKAWGLRIVLFSIGLCVNVSIYLLYF